MKLSPAMQRALDAAPFTYMVWGTKPMGGLPKGVTMATITALRDRGLIAINFPGPFERKVTKVAAPNNHDG